MSSDPIQPNNTTLIEGFGSVLKDILQVSYLRHSCEYCNWLTAKLTHDIGSFAMGGLFWKRRVAMRLSGGAPTKYISLAFVRI